MTDQNKSEPLHIKFCADDDIFLKIKITEFNNLVDYLLSPDSFTKAANQSNGHANVGVEHFDRASAERRLEKLQIDITHARNRIAARSRGRWVAR